MIAAQAVTAGLLMGMAVLAASPGARGVPSVLEGPGRVGPARFRARGALTRWAGTRFAGRQVLVGGADIAVLADRVAALSRAGMTAEQVWRILADRDERADGADGLALIARSVVTTSALGGSTAEGLRLAGDRLVGQGVADPGAGQALSWLAAACAVSQTSGAPLARVLDGLAVAVRAELQAARERDAALAGPRATATVLSWLPLAGLGLGALTGVDTVSVLLTTSPGRLCLVIGGGLWWAGRRWATRLVRRAEAADGLT